MDGYRWILSDVTRDRLEDWWIRIMSGQTRPGARIARILEGRGWDAAEPEDRLEVLLASKRPRIYAESEVIGDGSDWTAEEIALLGDIACVMPVIVFDDGEHHAPRVHEPPFEGHLAFVPGALLANGHGLDTPDLREVAPEGRLDPEAYHRLYERRLVPVFTEIDRIARSLGVEAVVTVPGLGCGQFAGPFHGRLGSQLGQALLRILERHGRRWTAIRLVRYDPYMESEDMQQTVPGGPEFRIRRLRGPHGRPQLCHPTAFEEPGDDFSGCRLFSLVAWDHVSWPGNDFYVGSRTTDDGVKAAATDAMRRITGVTGHYDRTAHVYRPPAPYPHWLDLVEDHNIRLVARDRVTVHPLDHDG